MALRTTLQTTFDNMAVTTFARRGPAMVKQTIDTNVLLSEVAVKPITSGMWRLEVPLEIGRNTSAGYLTSPDAKMELVDQDVASMAYYTPSLMACPVKYNRIEKVQNSGKEQFKNLSVLKSNQALRSMKEILGSNVYGNGSNFKTLGLDAAVPIDPTTTSVGQVPTAHVYWRSLVRNLGSWAANGHLGSANDYMFNGYLYASVEGDEDLFWVSDFNSYERYHRSLGTNVRYINAEGPTSILNNGRKTLSYQGRAWYPDRKCNTDTIFGLHRNDFEWHVAPGMNFEPTEMMVVPDRPLVSFMVLILFHQWIPIRRNRNIRFTNIQN